MVYDGELSVVDREARCLVKFSDLIEVNSFSSLFIRLLHLGLSERYFVLCHEERAVRFSEIKALICRGRFLTWFLGESGEEENQAESCVDFVIWFTASSISSVDFNLTLRFDLVVKE